MVRILYFAWVRERIGAGDESIPLPPEVTTVAGLLDHLRSRGAPHDQALTGGHLRVAVNQVHAAAMDPVADGDEIAIFPPVSGG
ncbi:MAG: molybdopterin converting factor subunit 1 [Magnetococcales bacterium]|nr:molybdopterin converting factor subunit 1 [Magnetococcales bacterium]